MDIISNCEINVVLKCALESIDGRVAAQGSVDISTGFEALDSLLRGFCGGELIAIAARPAMGKSTLLMNMALSSILTSDSNYPVIICTGYTSINVYMMRLIAYVSGADCRTISAGSLQDDDWPKLEFSIRQLRDKPLYITNEVRTPFELEELIQSVYEKHKKSPVVSDVNYLVRPVGHPNCRRTPVVFIDELHALKVVPLSPFEVQKEQVVRMLKNIAVTFKSPIIFTTAVAKSCEEKECKIPEIHELHEIYYSERLVNKMLMIYRDEVYNPESSVMGSVTGNADIIIAKNDQGYTGTVAMNFDGRYLKFSNEPSAEYY